MDRVIPISEYTTRVYTSGLLVMYTHNRGGNADSARLARKAQEKRPRQYRIHTTRVKSACVSLWNKRRHTSLLFLTITAPSDECEKKISTAWRLWLKNMATNRGLRQYVWVKERTKKGRIHYHILIDKKYVHIGFMQRAWSTAYQSSTGYTSTYSNSVRLGTRPVVNSIDSIAGYLTPYFTKNPGVESIPFEAKAYGYTEGLQLYTDVDTSSTYDRIGKMNPYTVFSEPYLVVMALHPSEAARLVYDYNSS